MELKALIWDVDGTLIDNEELHRAAFNQAFAEAGLDWRWNRRTYARLLAVSGGKERLAEFVQTDAPPLPAGDCLLARLHARKTDIYNQLLAQGDIQLRPGVARLLAEAQDAGLTLAIATTTSPANVRTLVSRFLGRIRWTVVAAGDVVARKKPAADVYRLVLEQLGLAPGHCLAVEDSFNGLTAAAGRAHVVRATLDGIAHGTADLLDVMLAHVAGPVAALRVDGGLTANGYLMQRQADLLGLPVQVAAADESTALGIAGLAGLGLGVLGPAEILAANPVRATFDPVLPHAERMAEREGWRRFVRAAADL